MPAPTTTTSAYTGSRNGEVAGMSTPRIQTDSLCPDSLRMSLLRGLLRSGLDALVMSRPVIGGRRRTVEPAGREWSGARGRGGRSGEAAAGGGGAGEERSG